MSENNSSKSPLPIIILLVCLIGIPITLLILFFLGAVNGTEFSPDDFSRRRFSYNNAPFVNWTIRKKSYFDRTTSVEQNLVLDGFIPAVINKKKTWHLISDSGSNAAFASDQCDARLLTNYLDLKDEEGEDFWFVWTNDNPKCAKVFWPHVTYLARDEMYLKIPDVMQFAMELSKDDEKTFTPALEKLIAEAYFELGEIDYEMGRFERAKSRLLKSLALEDSSQTQQLLDACNDKLDSQPVVAESEESSEE